MDSENFLRERVDTEQKELNEREDEPYQVGELCVCSSEGMGWLHRYTLQIHDYTHEFIRTLGIQYRHILEHFSDKTMLHHYIKPT